MQEKDMVSDILTGTKASIDSYTKAITEFANQQLRSTLQQLRNEAEQLQYQLFQIAEQKGYYNQHLQLIPMIFNKLNQV